MMAKASMDVVYSQLPLSVKIHEKEIGMRPTETSGFTRAFLEKKLPPRRLIQGDSNLSRRIFHMNVHRRKKIKEAGAAKKSLSNRDRKKLKLFEIKKEGQRYEDYLPLHDLWIAYIKDLIDFPQMNEKNQVTAALKFMKADLHGCIITVQRSKCASYVGTTGMILKESRNMFKIITLDNKVKDLPKQNSVFSVTVEGITFTIYGNHFRVKSTERSSRRFKNKSTTDL